MAYGNIRRAFAAWERALEIDWVTFLEGVSRNPKTGEWAVEVCLHLLAMGSGNSIRHEEGR
jgi:hypothetical protein